MKFNKNKIKRKTAAADYFEFYFIFFNIFISKILNYL
jgi:hypothetical protein